MIATLITGWSILGFAILGVLILLLILELIGVWRHDEHKVDTVSELYWTVRERVGKFRAPLAAALAAFLAWLWWHFTYEGKRSRKRYLNKQEYDPADMTWDSAAGSDIEAAKVEDGDGNSVTIENKDGIFRVADKYVDEE